jgi:lysozyme
MTNAISAQGLTLIQRFEGFRAEPAQLPDGKWVVGHGHVRIGEAGPAVNENEAADLLALDVAPLEQLVNEKITQSLNQSQFDALVSFVFSVGADAFAQSQVLRRANTGDFVAAAIAMDAWRKSDVNGELEVVDALVRRRAAEKALFLKDMPVEASPSVFVRAKLDHAASILGAPMKYVAAPEVGSIPVVQPQPEPAQRIAEILKSEPATEALLLTQVVPDDVTEEEGELVTAHAKPVARSLDEVREATRRAYGVQQLAVQKGGFPWFKRNRSNAIEAVIPNKADRRLRKMRRRSNRAFKLPTLDFSGSFENLGLVALLVFGLGLIAIGGSLLFGGRADVVQIAAAAALITPGLAAALMAGFGLRRPQPARIEA